MSQDPAIALQPGQQLQNSISKKKKNAVCLIVAGAMHGLPKVSQVALRVRVPDQLGGTIWLLTWALWPLTQPFFILVYKQGQKSKNSEKQPGEVAHACNPNTLRS